MKVVQELGEESEYPQEWSPKAPVTPNRVAEAFSPLVPTPPTARVRSGRFDDLARSTKLLDPWSPGPCTTRP